VRLLDQADVPQPDADFQFAVVEAEAAAGRSDPGRSHGSSARDGSGKELYALRKQTVEQVFGIIKEAMGFRRFLLGLSRSEHPIDTGTRSKMIVS
jgi:hypothetical protein